MNDEELVLVTGASGFVAMHCILELLKAGRRVRGTVRSRSRGKHVEEVLKKYVSTDKLELVEADLSRDAGWDAAVQGCARVMHVASPVPVEAPRHPDDVIVPAREGTLRVLRAAVMAGVRRVVLTSSTSAVLYGHPRDGSRTYDESDWSLLTDEVGPYERSKTLAERAAWEYVDSLVEPQRLELVAINPGVVLGPVLDADFSISGEVIRKLMTRELPGCPDLGWGLVDVRDVADVHILALHHPEAAGKRFILASEHTPLREIAMILKRHLEPKGYRIPTRRIPDFVLKFVALFDKTAALTVPELGKRQDVSSDRARNLLGFEPRSVERMVTDMADSMISCGVVPKPKAQPAAVAV